MSYIITKNGYTEIVSDPISILMDLKLRNRNKIPIDCEYMVEAEPEKYFVIETGIEKMQEDLLEESEE